MVRGRRARRDRGDKAVGLALALVGIVLIGVLAGGAWWVRKTKVTLDADNCPQTGIKALHVIMIDRSDPISGQQAQGIRQHVEKLKNNSSFGTRFDVYTFEGDTKHEMQPVVRVCAVGRPEDANELIENPDFVRRRYEERFSIILDRGLADLLQESKRANSPIIESIRAAAITSFGPISPGKIPLNLTLSSDMVQNSALMSHFTSDPNFMQLSKNSTWTALQPNLKGADVDILYLIRREAKRGSVMIQNSGHQMFWRQLIAASGGRMNMILPL